MDLPASESADSWLLEVDGEVFHVRRAISDGTHYDWVSGRNKNYGFTSSLDFESSEDAHRDSARQFLSMIDPDTGYME